MNGEKRKRNNNILLIVSVIFTILTIIAPLLSQISDKLKLSAKYAPFSILIWVIVWVTILRISKNIKIPKAQNRLLTFLVIASSVAFTAFILFCFKQ